jgi:hypothetical protein
MMLHTSLAGFTRRAAKITCIALLWGAVAVAAGAQDRQIRIGIQASPVSSWLRNNDDLILSNGGNLGLKLGAISEIAFKDQFYFTLGVNFAFHEGGELLYEIGGNYLPNSDLSDELLQTGDKPLPDGTTIRYNLQYLEFPVGFRYRAESGGNIRFFAEAPLLTFSLLTRGRGTIETDDAVYEDENIYKDLGLVNIFLGLGGGIEYQVSRTNSLLIGLFYEQGLLDVTRDDGYRAIENPDIIPPYLRQQDESRTTVGSLTLRLGFLF